MKTETKHICDIKAADNDSINQSISQKKKDKCFLQVSFSRARDDIFKLLHSSNQLKTGPQFGDDNMKILMYINDGKILK